MDRKRKISKYIKILFAICVLSVTFVLTGCGNKGEKKVLSIPEIGMAGGYELESDTLHCIVAVDGKAKYSKFESKTENHTIESYSDSTGNVMIDRSEHGIKYHEENFGESKGIYENPLKRVYNDLEKLKFEWMEESKNLDVFQAKKTELVAEQQQIDYTQYKIKMKWRDQKEYIFSFYQYADGATLISADAPDEINDRITLDTKWIIDMEGQCVRNTESSEEIGFEVIATSTGKALSPEGASTTTEKTSYVRVYVDKESGLIEKLQHFNDEKVAGLAIKILNDVEITKPEVLEGMEEMDSETLQMARMLILLIETLF